MSKHTRDVADDIRLTKRFGKTARIVIAQGAVQIDVPAACIDRLIKALLELKTLMEDGSAYNSGFMRLALIDGSGVEIDTDELSETGKEIATSLARELLEEFDPCSLG